MHEQAHLARRDCESLLAAELACAIYWFHPLVWHAARRLREEQEHAARVDALMGKYTHVRFSTEDLVRERQIEREREEKRWRSGKP